MKRHILRKFFAEEKSGYESLEIITSAIPGQFFTPLYSSGIKIAAF
jgi:hypothetical protein